MPHLARHRELVVRILRLMVSLCIFASLDNLQPSLLMAGALKVSWNANTEPDLAGYKIHYGQATGNYTASIDVGKVTQYTVNQLNEGVTYFFVVTAYDTAGNESGYSQEASAQVAVADHTPPSVASVKIIDQSTVEIKFNENVSKASAESKANYTIDNGITISSAALQTDNRTVILVTSPHASGKTYRITIQKIADRAPTPNVMAQAVTFNYTFQAADSVPPAVANFRAVNQQTLEVVFNEPVTAASAQNAANYTINNNITVQSAKLQADTKTVILTTSAHAVGVNYTLTVSGIADRAATPNVMSQPVSFSYSFQSVDNSPPGVAGFRAVNQQTLEVTYDESVSAATAEKIANYTINNGITISSAKLQTDTKTVILTTSTHAVGVNYTLTVSGIADRAATPNVMSQPVSFDYSFQSVDNSPPGVAGFRAVNQQTLEVTYDEPVSVATAQKIANYTISNGITISSAKLQADTKTVILTTSTHALGVNYTLTITGIADRAATPNVMSQPASFNYSFQAVDNTPPVVANVRAVNQTTVEVLFSEPVTTASAQNKANYTIDKGIAISSAALLTDTRTVRLTTGPHSDNETYSLTVRQIADRASPANVMTQAVTFAYLYQAEDKRAPEVNSATLTDLTHLLIVFNERVTGTSAQNVNNYRISDGIQVHQAQLAENGLEVTLLTSLHQYNKDYTITIVNIQDISPAANTITAGALLTYFLVNNPGGNPSGLSVNGLYPARYILDSLEVGDAYYIDRPYRITQIPNSKRGLLWIMTANADRGNDAERFLEFTLTREANIWVAYDNRATQAPNWLRDYFTRTNESIGVSESAGQLTLWKAHQLPGHVTFGGNLAPGVETTVSLSMYVVVIEELQGPKTGDSPPPQRFVLYQNYPNPFSITGGATQGRTEIKYYLEEQHQVVLTIHNMLGQAVRRLYNGMRSPGTHSVVWDGRDENGDAMPSGTYLCTLEIRDEVKNGKMTMAASLSRQTRAMTLLK